MRSNDDFIEWIPTFIRRRRVVKLFNSHVENEESDVNKRISLSPITVINLLVQTNSITELKLDVIVD